MTNYLFTPAPFPALPIQGMTDTFPVHRVFCVGRNYVAHAQEMGGEVDREAPWFFTKSAHHIHSGGVVPFAAGTQDYHHEIELVVALGESAANIAAEHAERIIFGHAVGLDMTRRDLQARSKDTRRPWCTAKDVEAGAVIGTIVPKVLHAPSGADIISLHVNDTQVQSAPLSDMVWSTAEVIAHLSRLYTLQPGDLIMTGTPAGVGPVQRGDHVVATCSGLPTLSASFE